MCLCDCLLWGCGIYCPSHAERSAGHKGPAVFMAQCHHLTWEHHLAAQQQSLVLIPSPTDLHTEYVEILHSNPDVFFQAPSFGPPQNG